MKVRSGHSTNSMLSGRSTIDCLLLQPTDVGLSCLPSTPWEVHFLPDERASANMAEFALRSLAGMAEANPVISLPGQLPHLGSHLTIHKLFYAIFIVLTVGHTAFFIWGFRLKRKLVEPRDVSYTEIAKLLSERYSASTEYPEQSYRGRPG